MQNLFKKFDDNPMKRCGDKIGRKNKKANFSRVKSGSGVTATGRSVAEKR
jgi:hypothetical protein